MGTLSAALRDDIATAILNEIDTGAGTAMLEIGTAGMASILAQVPFAVPSGTVASGVLTFTMPQTDASANATGTAAEARIVNRNGDTVISGLSVGVSGADVNLATVSISAGVSVTINSASITAPSTTA